jgi:medium-chain acyl-[acyl-carrier-protein] hydrolase
MVRVPFIKHDPWIETRATGDERIRLFCFPYAGGSSQIFRNWSEILPRRIGVYAVELPGRGPRLRDAPISDMSTLLTHLGRVLVPYLDRRFAFFGHSMGASIAYEAARGLASAEGRRADRLFVSAGFVPLIGSRWQPMSDLDDEGFIARLRELGGTPDEILAEPDLMTMLLPMLRADFRLAESYAPLPGAPLACPLVAFGGASDPEISIDDLAAWRSLAPVGFKLSMLPGDHYFLQSAQRELLAQIAEELSDVDS